MKAAFACCTPRRLTRQITKSQTTITVTSHYTRLLCYIITILCAPTNVARVTCYFGTFRLFCAHAYRQAQLHLQE
jgi:hypothetical protein